MLAASPGAPRDADLLPLVNLAHADERSAATRGPFKVEVVDQDWTDAARNNRAVPVRVYKPTIPAEDATAAPSGRVPIVIFSHGAGGSREGYAFIGDFLSSRGYLVVHLQHKGSDRDAVGPYRAQAEADQDRGRKDGFRVRERQPGMIGWLAPMISDPSNLENRPKDISFVIDELGRRDEWKSLGDFGRIAVAGHSFGSYTSAAIMGMTMDLPDHPHTSLADPRVKCAIMMSPQGAGTMGITDGSYTTMRGPTMIMTGTKDMGEGQRAAAWRTEVLRQTRGETFFINLDGGTHMTFAVEQNAGPIARMMAAPGLADHHRIILSSSAAFLDAFLRGDDGAKAWLREEGPAKAEGPKIAEWKHLNGPPQLFPATGG